MTRQLPNEKKVLDALENSVSHFMVSFITHTCKTVIWVIYQGIAVAKSIKCRSQAQILSLEISCPGYRAHKGDFNGI